MRRFALVLILVALSGCATVYDDRYGYYRGDGYGDYYYDDYDRARVGVAIGYGGFGYSAYDALFWGLQYSYFDPFWYPHFYYGVTYFPRYYGWSYWHAHDYWRWRHFHPYSPYYGSYWDHYYAWYRPGYGPRWRGHRPSSDPQRYGSARNAAERMARSRDHSRGYPAHRAWAGETAADGPRSSARRIVADGAHQRPSARRSATWAGEELPSRSYVPESRRRAASSGWLERSGDEFGRTNRRDRAVGGEPIDAIRAGGAFPSRAREPGLFPTPVPSRERGRSAAGFSSPRSAPPVRRSFTPSPPPAIRSGRPAAAPRSSSPARSLDRSSRSRRER